jgi:Putative zinc-finger
VNPTDHPTIDQIADLQEGILPAAEAAELRAHVDGCPECGETVAALSEVSDLLAAEGSESVRIPADVAARIHDALDAAAAERTAGVPSLAERRESQQRTRQRRTGRWVFGAAAAAAAVVVFGGAIGMLGENDGEDSGGVAADSAAEGAASPEAGPKPSPESMTFMGEGDAQAPNFRVDRDRVRAAALALASGSVTESTPVGFCATIASEATEGLRSQYGAPAKAVLLLVDEGQGTYRLVDCVTGALITKGTL